MPPDWPPEADVLLGTDFDFVVAARICRPLGDVMDRRKELGVPDFDPPPRYDPTVLMYTMWGLTLDENIAKAIGRSLYYVQKRRKRFGIPPLRGRPPVRIKEPPERIAELGTRPDVELADLWGRSPSYVWALRRELGIPRFRGPGRHHVCVRHPERIAELGKKSDLELAKLWGITKQRVHQLRKAYNIPPYSPPVPGHQPGDKLWGATVLRHEGDAVVLRCRCGREFTRTGKITKTLSVCGKCGAVFGRDWTNKSWNELTAIEWVSPGKWLFECSCGNRVVREIQNVRHGFTRSCGHLKEKYYHRPRKEARK
jgi:hypothetical protein